MGAWEMAELVKGFLHMIESLSSDPKYSCKICLLWCVPVIPELERDRWASRPCLQKEGRRAVGEGTQQEPLTSTCMHTRMCTHRAWAGGGQDGEIICSIIVLLAKKTERPEDSKNRQISVKTKKPCQIHYYFPGNEDLPINTNCVPAILQQGYYYYITRT